MNDIDSVIGRLDELEDSIGRIDEVIEKVDELEIRVDYLENEIQTIDTSFDVSALEDAIKGINTEIYYMRDGLR